MKYHKNTVLVGYFQRNLLKMLESMNDFTTFSREPREKKGVAGYKNLKN